MENIIYKEIQKYNNNFISKVLVDNNIFRVKINNLNIHKNLYQKKNIVYLELSFDKDDITKKFFEKLKNYTINHVYQKYKDKMAFEKMEKRYINNIKEENNKFIINLEVDDRCQIIEKNQYNEVKKISNKELKKNDIVDLILIFEGILYNKSDFRNKFIIIEIIQYIEKISIFDEKKCYIENDSDDDNNNNETINYLSNNFKNLCINKKEIPEME
jgi:hypothetical protein